jgi:hypothetical protein
LTKKKDDLSKSTTALPKGASQPPSLTWHPLQHHVTG